ncbi:MAG: GNAT family N-acetyltransferase [Candidatus Thorarchaeota archaeon]
MLSGKNYKYVTCDYRYIPRELLEQVKGVEWTPDQFYKIHEALSNNPANMLFALIPRNEKEKKILGYLWAQIDINTGILIINSMSIQKDLWNQGIMTFTEKFLRKMQREIGLKKIYWLTNRPKAFEKMGYNQSKYSLMCLDKEE